jgi:ubiquinone/menaquinone biosynthesis C-methylase UbiE
MIAESIHCPSCSNNSALPFLPCNLSFKNLRSSAVLSSFRHVQCTKCNLIFMNPMPSKEELAQIYKTSYRASEFSFQHLDRTVEPPVQIPWSGNSFLRGKTFLSMLQDCVPKGLHPKPSQTFLDFGGYQGFFISGVQNFYGCRFVLADFNSSGLEFARKSFGVDTVELTSDFNYEALPKSHWITMVHVLEHSIDPFNLLQNFNRQVLADDGYLYIEVPNIEGFSPSDPVHLFHFSVPSLRQMLQLTGFEIIGERIHGFPSYESCASNSKAHISVLARKIKFGDTSPKTLNNGLNAKNLQKELCFGYFKISSQYHLDLIFQSFRRILTSSAVLFLNTCIFLFPSVFGKLLSQKLHK